MATTLQGLLLEAVGGSNVAEEDLVHRVRPGSPIEVGRVLAIAREKNVGLAPMGTGSIGGRAGAGPGRDPGREPGRDNVWHTDPARPRIVLDMRRMTTVLHVDRLSLTVHVQAGIATGDLEQRLNEDGLTLGDFPAETLKSTVGGLLSARAPGRATSRLGPIESSCIGLSVVLADGRNVHVKAVPRRATGPDLMRLFLGSEGTLGITTAAVLRLYRLPETRTFATAALPSIDSAVLAAQKLFRRGVHPSAMRIYDAEDAMTTGLCEVDPHGQAVLLATLAGPADLVAVEERILHAGMIDRGGTMLPSEPAQKWWRERTGAQGVTAPTESGGARFQVAAPLSRLSAVYRGVRSSLAAHGTSCSAFLGHFHENGGSIYFSFARNGANDDVAREAAMANGARPAAEMESDEALVRALHAMKKQLDPQGILHGGRLA